jgi:ADP-ribose pyrophosphatase YjhB (NUDIX family)
MSSSNDIQHPIRQPIDYSPQGRAIRHCRNCGAATAIGVPDDGDTKERAICTACGTVHYLNPLMVVGTVPYFGDKVLLCKRNIEPRLGKWTLPAGFLELGESCAQGAERETHEEAGAQIEMEGLFSIISVPRVGQVHLFYKAKLLSDQFNPGFESMEARLFSEAEIPWDEISFLTVKKTLESYFADREQGAFQIHDLVLI